ncbi:MAG: hypothetical protein U1E65_27720 [Myxococcota bacterium]
MKRWFTVPGCLLAAACGGNAAPPSVQMPSPTPTRTTTTATAAPTLAQLGIKTDLGARTDASGRALPTGYQPLGRPIGTLARKAEIYVAGTTDNGRKSQLLDDQSAAFADIDLSALGADFFGDLQQKKAISADVDGDGVDEILVLYYSAEPALKLSILKVGGAMRTLTVDPAPLAPSYAVTDGDLGFPIGFCRGDFDSDGKDEVAIGFSKRLYVLGALDTDTPVTLAAHEYAETNAVFVAAGNLDADPEDELVVTYTKADVGYLEIYNGDLSAPVSQQDLRLQIGTTSRDGAETMVAIGDIDGDQLGEIILMGRRSGDWNWDLFVMDDALSGYALQTTLINLGWFEYSEHCDIHGCGYGHWRPNVFTTLDYDGDGVMEIAAFDRVLQRAADGSFNVLANFSDRSTAAVGDVDGDRGDDLVVVVDGRLKVLGRDAASGQLVTKLDRPATYSVSSDGRQVQFARVTLALPNVDHDSRIVRYTGNHTLMFANPTVLTAVAAPPYRAGVQDAADCTTTFGRSQTSGVDSSESFGVSIGVSFGYEWNDPTNTFGGSFQVELEKSFDWTTRRSRSVETSYSYTTGPGDDMVVYTAVPFDVYSYTVLSSPVAEEVGKVVTINLPRKPQIMAASRSFYNAHNGDGPDVDKRILQHTPGDPSSYPKVIDRETLRAAAPMGQFFASPVVHPTVGAGKSTVGVSASEGSGNETSSSLGITVEVKGKAAGVTFGASAGVNWSWSYGVSYTRSVVISGSVGQIPDGQYDYGFGAMLYPHPDGLMVVNYWVE